MELLYQNGYGAMYKMNKARTGVRELQMIVDTVGVFMSRDDLDHLLGIVRKSNEPCTCAECGGNHCNKIWCSGPLVDICLKVDEAIIDHMEDLIQGAQFMLDMDATLEKYRLK
ncbi:hypothetical protein [Zobellia uliginosa]|uniref:hypothetical protein n=1 Tax=Zobellia uliginosa TaxID=143224 RepID=UPI0026E1ACEA|nr:hypothetical protein [Zobellia uliginosa]MDO6518158.1 hypothetical protein [Zobellia uliginosa]